MLHPTGCALVHHTMCGYHLIPQRIEHRRAVVGPLAVFWLGHLSLFSHGPRVVVARGILVSAYFCCDTCYLGRLAGVFYS